MKGLEVIYDEVMGAHTRLSETMMLRDDVEELQTLRYELERQKRRVFLRKILKVFLIGFFIWKDIDDRISAIDACALDKKRSPLESE